MDNEFIQFLTYAHNVECPRCGSKASFTLTGATTFNSNYCGHLELEELVDERLGNPNRFYSSDTKNIY